MSVLYVSVSLGLWWLVGWVAGDGGEGGKGQEGWGGGVGDVRMIGG